jgi:hypothetical protein
LPSRPPERARTRELAALTMVAADDRVMTVDADLLAAGIPGQELA